ncbi:MAG: TIGR01906 family membrane protein [Clostridia bacterium]|nr:TIGR01906 family membrane protein [Clostridia bacterium]
MEEKSHGKRRAINSIVTALFVILLFLFLISLAISLPILNRWFYYIQIKTLDLESTGFTYDEIKEAFDLIMDYLTQPWNTDFWQSQLANGETQLYIGVFKCSADGASHFDDCKTLFLLDIYVMIISGVLLAAICVLWKLKIVKVNSLKGHSAAFYTAIAAIVAPVALVAVIASVGFDEAFNVFHTIFFPGKDNWIFNSRYDQIILVLPEEFFMNCAIFIAVGLVAFSAIIIIIDCVICRNKRKKALKNQSF